MSCPPFDPRPLPSRRPCFVLQDSHVVGGRRACTERLLQKKIIALPPALAIAAQVVMGTLAGGLGLVVATPLTAGALVLVKEAYVRDRLGED